MANDLNQCNFIGRLGKDPEIKPSVSGIDICNFSIAIAWKSKEKEVTEWVNVVAFGKLAEICGQYLSKGSQVYISGKMKTETYEKDGITRYSTKIVAENMQMLGGKTESNEQNAKPKPSSKASKSLVDMDDDLPF